MTVEFTPVTVEHQLVPTYQRPTIEGKLAKVNVRLAKLGAPAATVAFGPIVESSTVDEFGRPWTFAHYETVTVTGVAARHGGWSAVASLDHTLVAGEAFVSRFPAHHDTVIPDGYRWTGPACDHCRINIARNLTILFVHDDGRWTQVGTSCVLEYLGIDPATALWLCTAFDVYDGDEEGGGAGGYITPGEYLAMACEVVAAFGFRPTSELGATRDGVSLWLHAKGSEIAKHFPELDLARGAARAAEVTAWVLAQPDTSEFIQSAQIAVRAAKLAPRIEGLLACLPHVYSKAVEKAEAVAAEKAAAPEGFAGTVGQKLICSGRVAIIRTFDGVYGVKRLVVVRTTEGHRVSTVGTGRSLFDVAEGDEVTWAGKVVEHSDGKYGRESKCKLVKIVAAPVGAAA